MSGRNWSKDRSRQLIRNRGVDDITDQSIRSIPRSRPRLRPGHGSVTAAALWLVENRQALRDAGKNPIPALQREFGLTTKQCVEAIRLANATECRGD